jgi:hypothetical protein
MGWRANMGVAERKNIPFNIYTQNTQNTQILSKENPRKDNIADIADIAGKNQKFKKHKANLTIPLDRKILKIKKMTVCLHGKPCGYLYVENQRQMCRRNDKPVFDMKECPMNKWCTGEQVLSDSTTMPKSQKTIWCSINCPKGEMRQIDDMPVLWCNELDKAVMALQKCPQGHWVKDTDGRPHDIHIK